MRFAANGGQAYRRASRRIRRLFNQAVFDCIEVCDRKLASFSYRTPFDLLCNTGEFDYDAEVAHTLSYPNPEELQVRISRWAQAAGRAFWDVLRSAAASSGHDGARPVSGCSLLWGDKSVDRLDHRA